MDAGIYEIVWIMNKRRRRCENWGKDGKELEFGDIYRTIEV